MQSAIAEKHTIEPGTHQPCTQSLEKVNLDNSKSNNNQSNNTRRQLKLDTLRNSSGTQATTQNIMLQKIMQKSSKIIFEARFKAFLGVLNIDKAPKQV